jgi:hypothetical protein
MSKKRWILVLIPAILVVVGFGLSSCAGPPFPGRMGIGPMYRMNMLFDELELTSDQGMALKELVLAETPDEAAIRKASTDLGNAIADAAVQASALAGEARSILTPEQVERFKEISRHRQKVFHETMREWKEQSGGL